MADPPSSKSDSNDNQGVHGKQVRSSALLLSGRIISLLLNLLTQVFTVRYLSKVDYGLFAYAMALVTAAANFNRFAQDRAVGRFAPIYEERNDLAGLAGCVAFALGTVLAIGVSLIVLMVGLQSWWSGTLTDNPQAVAILVVLIALAPATASDAVLTALMAAFGKANAIFFRRHILNPGLRLAAIGLTILTGGDVYFLAASHMVAGVVGVLLYVGLLIHLLKEHDVMRYFRPRHLRIDFGRLLRFSLPTLSSDLINAVRLSIIVVILEAFHGLARVAEYQAVMPISRLTYVVVESFSLLFLPMAARLLAQKNTDLLSDMKAQVSLWVLVLTYPVLALCLILTEPLIHLLIGERYLPSAPVLAILALGFFFSAVLGLDLNTLRALGKVKLLLGIDITCIVIAIMLGIVLVPAYGIVGAALATTIAMIAQAVFCSLVLWRTTGNNPLPWAHTRIYLIISACIAGLWLPKLIGFDSLPLTMLLLLLTTLLIVFACRNMLRITEIFPEATKLPGFLRRFLGVRKT